MLNANDEVIPAAKFSRQSRRFPKSSVRILKAWLATNSHRPHPSDMEKNTLHEQTGLSVQQISNWFANARRRRVRTSTSASLSNSQLPNLKATASTSVSDVRDRTSAWTELNPLERWRNSPPEEEAAPVSAIANAMANNRTWTVGSAPSACTLDSYAVTSTRALSETSFESTSSFWTSGSSSSAQSIQSNALSTTSNRSTDKARVQSRTRHRRGQGWVLLAARKSQNDGQSRVYQCTFCTDTFKTKYDWTRHEGTLHLVLERWTCTPSGPVYFDEAMHKIRCALCDEPDPSESHISAHDYQCCNDKLPAQRSFRRKDHLQQHLRLVHGISETPSSLPLWKTTITHVVCRCGFCGERFTSWQDRNEHLSDHFRDGKNMKDWTGDRGLEPSICILVENAMPPYLIGTETNEFEPFSASRNTNDADASGDVATAPKEPTSFEGLTVRLVAYVRAAIDSGTLITDEIVRRQARLIMFGDDDAWNQTPADNAQWLSLFKNGLGLGNSTTTHLTDNDDFSNQPPTDTATSVPQYQVPSIHFPQPVQGTSTAVETLRLSQPDLDTGTGTSTNPIPTAFWNLSNIPTPFLTPECLAEFQAMEQNGQTPFMPDQDFHYQYQSQTIDDLLAEVQNLRQQGSNNNNNNNNHTVVEEALSANNEDSAVCEKITWLPGSESLDLSIGSDSRLPATVPDDLDFRIEL